MGWYNTNWEYRKKITIDHTEVSADETDFPIELYISNASSDFWDNITAETEIVITEDNGTTKLKREVEKFDDTNDKLHMFFKGDLSSSVDTEFYIYYGNLLASETDDAETWDDNYICVWHLSEDGTGTRYDSTSNDNDLTTSGYTGIEATDSGKIDGADYLSSSKKLYGGDVSGLVNDLTLEYWLYPHTSNLNRMTSISKTYTYEFDITYYSRKLYYYHGGSDYLLFSSNYHAASTWEFRALTRNQSTKKLNLYVNDTHDITDRAYVTNPADGPNNITLGGRPLEPRFISAAMDEVRISDIVRDTDWLLTQYNNQNDPLNFYSLALVESVPRATITGVLTATGINTITF